MAKAKSTLGPCLGLSGPYRTAYDRVLPNALQVADPYAREHFSLISDSTKYDAEPRTKPSGYQGRKPDPLDRIRHLFDRRFRTYDRPRLQTRMRSLLDAGDPRGELRKAWHATETVRGIYTIGSRSVALRYTLQLVRRPPGSGLSPGDQPAGPNHQPMVPPDHHLAHLEGDLRTYRGCSTTGSSGSNGAVGRVPHHRRTGPSPSPPLCRDTRLGPTRDGQSPRIGDETLFERNRRTCRS